MPPRLRRPAAVIPPPGSGRRRPAAREEASVPVGAADTVEYKFGLGENVDIAQLPISALKVGQLLIFDEAKYFGGICKVAGRYRELWQGDHDQRLKVHITGTTNADLLAYATGTADRLGEVHLCPPGCAGEPHAPGLIHSLQVRSVKKEGEKGLVWELNLEIPPVDELESLRRKQEELEKQLALAKGEAGAVREKKVSRSRRRRREKKKKKKKKGRSRSSSKTSTADQKRTGEEKVRRKRKWGGRSIARKDLSLIYGGTGLDPQAKIRRRVMHYAKKKLRAKASSSSSNSSTSTSRTERSSEEEGDLLQDSNKIRSLHRHGPGLLAAMGVGRMKEAMVELEGLWKEEEASLPPIAMKYVRSTLHGKLSGGALREVMTLASMLDLMMMGRVSEAADLGMQRLKSIERVSQGSTWASTEKLELIGTLAPQISTRAEMSVAAKELKLEHQVKGGASLYKGKGVGAPDSKGKKGKAEDKRKGKRSGEGDRSFKEKKDK